MMEPQEIRHQPRQKQPDQPVRAGQGVEHVKGRRGDHPPSLGSRLVRWDNIRRIVIGLFSKCMYVPAGKHYLISAADYRT